MKSECEHDNEKAEHENNMKYKNRYFFRWGRRKDHPEQIGSKLHPSHIHSPTVQVVPVTGKGKPLSAIIVGLSTLF